MRTPSVVVDKIFPLEQKMGFSGCHLITYKKKRPLELIFTTTHFFISFFEIGK